jgi:hypothetical protein
MLRQPLDRGDALHYRMTPESAAVLAGIVLDRVGLDFAEQVHPDSTTWLVVGTAPPSFTLFAGLRPREFVRVVVGTAAADVAVVRTLAGPSGGLWSSRDWSSPVYREFERQAGRVAIPVAGSRVRYAVRGNVGPLAEGTVQVVRGDTLVLAGGRPVAQADLSRLDLSRGTRGHSRLGALLGFTVGGLIGYVAGSSAAERCEAQRTGFQFCFQELAGVLTGTLLGGLVGAVVGAQLRTDAWWPSQPAWP